MKTDFPAVVQIGLVVRDLEHTVAHYESLLGWRGWNFNAVDTRAGKGRRFTFGGAPIEARARIAWMEVGAIEIELIEPQDENSIYAEFIRDRGAGLHHVMLATKDYVASLADFEQKGYAVVASGELQQTRFALLDTVEDLGMLIELAEGGPLVPDGTSGESRQEP
jgi:4-hydroxyphenylpyruvate dioxygenase-like putative hemolysin